MKRIGKKELKKIGLVILIVLIFSFVAEVFSNVPREIADSTKTELIDEDYLNLSYDYEAKNDEIQLEVSFKTQSEDSQMLQRLKFKVTDENDEVIDYPAVENMKEKGDWLIEKNFSQSMDGKLFFEVPKSCDKLRLYVQMDQKGDSEDSEVYEDILDLKKPFELEIEKSTDESEKVEIKKKDKTSTHSEEFVGPKTDEQIKEAQKQAEIMRASERAAAPNKYGSKEPQYKTDNGKYPEYSWQPQGQKNVINHQGGEDSTGNKVWDGIKSWNTSKANYTNSYIRYGVDKQREDIALRKYATETEKKDTFNVRLNVRGNSITKPGADIYFVLDNSASMGKESLKVEGELRKDLAVDALQNLINKFIANLPEGGSYMRVGGVIYSDGTAAYKLSDNTNEWQSLVNVYRTTKTNGNTFTQGAVEEGRKMLKGSLSDRRKIILLLTDGGPSLSWIPRRGVSDPTMYFDPLRIIENGPDSNIISFLGNTESMPTTKIQNTKGYSMWDGNKITSHITPANSIAADARDDGIEIHSIAIGIKRTWTADHDDKDLIKGLYRMATRKADSDPASDAAEDYYFYHAEKKEDFNLSFDEWYQSILSTVENGVIEDPLGDKVNFDGEEKDIKVKQIENGAPPISDLKKAEVTLSSDKRTITINNINLYGEQEIQIDYPVRLRTEDDDFVSEQWYPTNGETTLQPTPDRSNEKLKFGVPSVKAEVKDFVIPVEKVWEDDDNKWGTRGAQIEAELQKQNSEGDFELVETKTLKASNNSNEDWKYTYLPVEGRGNIYRIKEPSRTPKYAKVEVAPDKFTQRQLGKNKVIITNRLLRGSTYFYKYKEDGTAFDLSDPPRFSITHTNGEVFAENMIPDEDGKVIIENIPIGNYTLKETYTPERYSPMKDVPIKVEEKDNGMKVEITFADGKGEGYVIKNELKRDVSVPVEKVWEDKGNYWEMREGVTFKTQEKRDDVWSDVGTITLPENGSWKSAIKTDREDRVFRILEVAKTDGYAKPVDVQSEFSFDSLAKDGSDSAKITNNLLTGEVTFNKFLADGVTPFSGDDLPKFTAKRDSDKKVLAENIPPDKNGKVTIKDIPVGEFTIEESHVPAGFEKMVDIKLKAVEKSDGSGVTITLDNSASSITKRNLLKRFALVVEKVDQDGEALEGASFELTRPDASTEQSTGDGPTFTFDGLESGEYVLKETEMPNSYEGMAEPLHFTVKQDGTVDIPEHENVKGTWTLGKADELNTINLTVSNKRVHPGTAPNTGGKTAKFLFEIASILVIIGGLLGSFYWLYNRTK